jgi:DNA polymerase-3 subunit epsilon
MLMGRFATPMGTVPNLGALCWALDIPYDPTKAHAADYDVDCTAQAFFRGLDWGWFKIETGAVALAA